MCEDRLELTPPREDLREAFLDYVEEFREAGEGLWQRERDQVRSDFAGFLRERRDAAAGRNLPPGRVPDSHFWLVSGGRVLGTIRIRHRLTENLAIEGGHIGYGVRPSERNRGRATRMLAMALVEARRLGLRRVLVTCDKDNLASARVIRKNGGVLDSETTSPRSGKPVQRYWIDLPAEPPTQPTGGNRADEV